jgi:uncharacterized protein (TIGR02466 family)
MPAPTSKWLEASEIHPMFPTFVWKLQLRRELVQPVLDLIARLRGPAAELAPGSAWQSAHDVHELPELRELVGCFHEAVRSVLRFLRIGNDDFAITGCWANLYAPGAAHRMHTHPNNFLSGVYYVRTAEGANTINFHDPRAQSAVIRPAVTALTGENTDQVVMPVEPGVLLLFPAYLPHSVDENRSTTVRASLSFNVMFRGFAETIAKPMWGEK